MKLPNAEHAVVEIEKLTEYCLDLSHPRGRHKARVFAAALGITVANAYELRAALLDAVRHGDAIPGLKDGFGQRYVIEFDMAGPNGRATVRSAWIVRTDEDFPRLVSCHVA